MAKELWIEVGVQLAIDADQDVHVEPGGDSGGIVISSEERVYVLHHVRSQQQRIASQELGTHTTENFERVRGREVSDARAYVKHQLSSSAGSTILTHALGVVRHDGFHSHFREFRLKPATCLLKRRFRHIDGMVGHASL